MNASPHHPKVKVSLRLGEPLAVAGGLVTGKVEMECKADKGLGIGVIMVELFAIEELTSRDHSATSTFLHSRRIFQGPGLPPSNSVHPFPQPGDPPLPPNYYGARRGTTTFLFRFLLPPSSPSSINFGSGLANVRYEVRASVGVSWKGERRLVTDKRELDVVESFEEDFARGEPEGVIVGENGKLWVQGRVIGGVLVAGQPACVELHVKNHSSKKNSGLSITLMRELQLPNFPSTQKAPLQISDTLTSVSFRGQEYVIQSGAEGVANLVFDVPRNARGVKGGPRSGDEEEDTVTEALFEVRCIIGVKLSMGFGSKDIRLDIPVPVLHPAALPQLPPSVPYPLPPIQPYSTPMPDMRSQTPYALPISPMPEGHEYDSSPYDYPLSPHPLLSYTDPQHQWIPPPSQSPLPMIYQPYASGSPPYYQQPTFSPPPVVPSHAIPLRPSSAEPTPSHPLYNLPPGLPASAVQQPLIPLMTGGEMPPHTAEREEGKGERASRISHHLRMSSRNRSVSPQPHRYPLPTVPEPYYAPILPLAASVPTQSIPIPPIQPDLGTLATETLNVPVTTASSLQAEIVAPRPVLSPKHSFSLDPVTHATLSKSDRIRTLERMAAQAEKANSDMSTSVPELNFADKDKTLPTPPVPSEKIKVRSAVSESRPRADTLFPPTGDLIAATPPTPTLAAVTSLKVPRAAGGEGGLSGLDALEARLLAEVGTRKVEQNGNKPDVRSILPQPIAIPRPNTEIEPAVDSAISSLRLPGVEAGPGASPKLAGNSPLVTDRPASIHSNSHDGGRTERGRAKERTSDGFTKKSGKKSGRKGKDHASAERDEEVHRMRKVAKGRVTDWLQKIDPAAAPDVASSSSPSPASEHPVGNPMTLGEESTLGDTAHSDKAVADSDEGFVPIETIRLRQKEAELSGKRDVGADEKPFGIPRGLKFNPPRPFNLESRYDIRSARGGRGGKVTAVAALWASQAQVAKEDSRSPPPIKPPKLDKPMLKFIASQPEISPSIPTPRPARTPVNLQSTSNQQTAFSAANPSEKRVKMIKSSSVPAVVSSSLATPMLSSSASLARPSPALGERTKLVNNLLPTVTENRSESSPLKKPAPKGELAFGQARLRELIKRYQGQPS
ncbi:unnamed protein product [Somion occarium]|uniref:Arrestin-like N-terminal domain-containing protein n=1 Tax=Somion occarium TaxID=3059160 RepID=A0ABP1E979_9APHY